MGTVLQEFAAAFSYDGDRCPARGALEAYAEGAVDLRLFDLADALIGALDAADGDPALEPSGWTSGGIRCTLPEDSEYDGGDTGGVIYGANQSHAWWRKTGEPIFAGVPPIEAARELGLAE